MSISPLFLTLLTHFTVFFTEDDGEAVTRVPSFFTLKELLIFIGIFFDNRGSNVRGWICFAPNNAISIASMYDTSLSNFAFFTIFGSAVIRPSTSLINQISSAFTQVPIIVAE